MTDLSITNAAGHIKGDGESFRKLLRSAVSGIVFGSVTVPKREGSTGQNFVLLDDGTSCNSIQLRNEGAAAYDESLPPLVEATKSAGKDFILSIAPLSLEDFGTLSALAIRLAVDKLKGNFGCPNVHYQGTRKPIFAYDHDLTEAGLVEIRKVWRDKPLKAKLSPYEDDDFSVKMALLMNKHLNAGDSVVLTNTKPDYSPKDAEGRPLLRAISPDGTEVNAGGMAGTALKPLVRRNIQIFRSYLRSDIKITAVGGTRSGQDILDYEEDGADDFEIGTAYFYNDDPRIFSRVADEYYELAG